MCLLVFAKIIVLTSSKHNINIRPNNPRTALCADCYVTTVTFICVLWNCLTSIHDIAR